MVVVGSDVHKQTHTFVGVDEAARELGHKTFPATTAGHQAAIRWARERFGAELRWAVEDCRHLSARLERDLLTAGQRVVRVPPKMMAEQRRIARTRGKSDPIDAAAVARAALREPGPAGGQPRRDLAAAAAARRSQRRPRQGPNSDDQPAVVAGPRARSRLGAEGTSLDLAKHRRALQAHLESVSRGRRGRVAGRARPRRAGRGHRADDQDQRPRASASSTPTARPRRPCSRCPASVR